MRLFSKRQSTQSVIFLHANLLFAIYTDEKTSDLCHVWGIKWDNLTSSVNDVSVSLLFMILLVKIPSASTICLILKSTSDYEKAFLPPQTLCSPSVPTEQKTTVLPPQSQSKLWEAVHSLKLESCSVMGATQEGLFSS